MSPTPPINWRAPFRESPVLRVAFKHTPLFGEVIRMRRSHRVTWGRCAHVVERRAWLRRSARAREIILVLELILLVLTIAVLRNVAWARQTLAGAAIFPYRRPERGRAPENPHVLS